MLANLVLNGQFSAFATHFEGQKIVGYRTLTLTPSQNAFKSKLFQILGKN